MMQIDVVLVGLMLMKKQEDARLIVEKISQDNLSRDRLRMTVILVLKPDRVPSSR